MACCYIRRDIKISFIHSYSVTISWQLNAVPYLRGVHEPFPQPRGETCHAVDGPPSKTVSPDRPWQNNWSPRTEYRSHTWSPPPAADGPTLGIVFSKSVEPEKWTRKDEAVSAVSLRLGFKAS